jgi:tetratricopeptide (TPR) repeat protein
MTFVFHISDLLNELYPEAKGDEKALVAEIAKHYRVGRIEPTVRVENGIVTVEIDERPDPALQRLFQEAWTECEQGRFAQARPKLEQLVEQEPWMSQYHAMLGQVCSELGDQEEGIDHLIEALRWDPANLRALVMMGNIWANHRGEPDTAMTYYREALRLNPGNYLVATNMAAMMHHQGRNEEARQLAQQAIDAEPGFPNTHHLLGLVLAELGQNRPAFDAMVEALRLDQSGTGLYQASLSMAISYAQGLAKESARTHFVEEFAEALGARCGKPVLLQESQELTTSGRLELAENHGRNEHRVVTRPGLPAVEHLHMHELYHLRMILDARDAGENKRFITHDAHRMAFQGTVKGALQRVLQQGVPPDKARQYYDALFTGLMLQAYNAPLDLFIEYDMHREYPALRPVQFLSLGRMLQEVVEAMNNKDALALAPPSVISANRTYNITQALLYRELFGVDRVAELKATPQELRQADKFYAEFKEYREDREPAEEYEVLQHWAKDLQLQHYFALEPEVLPGNGGPLDEQLDRIEADPIGTYEKDPEKVRQMEQFLQAHQAGDTNPAMVMYMVDALKFFSDKTTEQIKKTAFEIAMLGTQGIHPDKQGYKLAHVPGVSFSGYHLLAYYYVSFKRVLPELLPELKLPFDDEYALAEQFSQESP